MSKVPVQTSVYTSNFSQKHSQSYIPTAQNRVPSYLMIDSLSVPPRHPSHPSISHSPTPPGLCIQRLYMQTRLPGQFLIKCCHFNPSVFSFKSPYSACYLWLNQHDTLLHTKIILIWIVLRSVYGIICDVHISVMILTLHVRDAQTCC